MSRRLEFLLLFLVGFAVSVLGYWLMNPTKTRLSDWLVPSLGEGRARVLPYAVVGGVAAIGFTKNKAVSRNARISDGA